MNFHQAHNNFFLTNTVEVSRFLGGVLSTIAPRSSAARDPHGSASNLIYQFHNLSTLWRSRSLRLDSVVHVYNLGGFSQPRSTGLLVCALLSRHTQQGFVLPYNMSFTSASFYGVLLNEDFTLSYMDAINESPDPCSQTEGSWKVPRVSSRLRRWNPQRHSVQVLLTTCIIPSRGKRAIMTPNLRQPWTMLRTRDVISHGARGARTGDVLERLIAS